MKRSVLKVLTAVLLIGPFAAGSALAQFPIPGSGSETKPEAAAPAEVPDARRSARATMHTFLTATVAAASPDQRHRLDEAVACLNLSRIAISARADVGPELAIKLKEIIDRVRFVDYEAIPDDPKGSPYVFYQDEATKHAIVINRDEDGQWRFTAETVGSIDELYRALSSKARVEGVGATALSPALWLRDKMPEGLKDKVLLMEHWQWLVFFAVVLLGLLVGRIARWVLRRPAEHWLAKRELVTPSDLILRVLKPLGLAVTALFWWGGLPFIGLGPGVYAVIIVMVKFLAAFSFVWFFFRVLDVVRHILQARAAQTTGRFDDLLVPLVVKSGKVVVVAVGIVFIANSVGISTTSLVAALGLGGLAVALAAQDTVKNFFGSLTVILDRPFEVGDAVVIGGNTEGVVEELGFRSTRIRTYENSLITLPNSNLISAKVDNLGRRNWRRLKTNISVTYDTSPAKLESFCEGLRALAESNEVTRDASTVIAVNALAASSIDILFIVAFETREYAVAIQSQHRILLDVITLANRLGVEFAFPTQTLHIARSQPLAPAGESTSADAVANDSGKLPLMSLADTEGAIQLGRAQAQEIAAARAPLGTESQESPVS